MIGKYSTLSVQERVSTGAMVRTGHNQVRYVHWYIPHQKYNCIPSISIFPRSGLTLFYARNGSSIGWSLTIK